MSDQNINPNEQGQAGNAPAQPQPPEAGGQPPKPKD